LTDFFPGVGVKKLSCRPLHIFRLFRFGVFALAFLAAPASATTSQQFVFNRADFPTGQRPTGIAVADVNGDGIQDLIVTNNSDNTVSVLLGQPDGIYGTKTDFPTGNCPYSIVVGDFNRDGKPDIAVTDLCESSAAGAVSMLIGNGDGTFKPHVEYVTGLIPIGITAGDFRGDGNLDLAVVDSCGQTCGFVSILLGNGDGTFQPKTDYVVGQNPSFIVGQDLNGDGKMDLAVANSSNSISILLGKGDGTFQAHMDYPSAASPAALAVADFNGDKFPDLVVTHNGVPWALTLLKGNGDGTFQPEQQIPLSLPGGVATAQIAALDLNADGKQDIVLTVSAQSGAVVLLGNGDGTFQPSVTYTSGRSPFAFAARDVNNDGIIDLEVADEQSNDITVLLGNGDGTFSPRKDLPIDPLGINLPSGVSGAIADFNKDGIPDLAVADTNGTVTVLLGKGQGQYQSPITLAANGSGSMSIADFNGDGIPDIALTNAQGAVVLLGKGDGTFGSPLQVPTSSPPRQLVVGDFNNDGKQDLVVLGNGFLRANPIYVFLGNGDGTFQPPKQFWSSPKIPMGIAAGDFNRDGKLDLVATVNPNGIAVMLGNGDGTFQFQTPPSYPTDELPIAIAVADLNSDGNPDIVALGNKVDVFLGKGDGTFPNRVDYDGSSTPFQVTFADVNADGKLDIVIDSTAGTGPPAIEILLGNGDGTFLPRVEIALGGGLNDFLAVGDLNQDGTPDLLVIGGVTSEFLSTPHVTLSRAAVDFGSVDIGTTSANQTVTLTNIGNGPLDLSTITPSGGYAVTSDCGSSVNLRASCALQLTFTPAAVGTNPGTLTLLDNSPPGQQSLLLFGSGQTDYALAVSAGSSDSQTVTAGGSATYPLTVSPIGGFSQLVSFSCTGAPTQTTCTVSPSSATLDGKNSLSLSVQVTTTARSSSKIF
jgi:FG-GAP-like repeat/Abnormal spindle-like microcephaly-assoc'd, ASPM-SPD-2-Hydin